MPIEHVNEVCRIGTEECCAFLTVSEGFECAKGSPIEAVIWGRLAAGTMRATGDNCDGWEMEN